MSDPTVADQVETEQVIEENLDDPKVLLRQARSMIPVGQFGIRPEDWAQQVQFAQDVAKGHYSLPKFLRKNIGDCLAIIDIAARMNMSPYMVAQECNVQNDRLGFSSKLYHAFAQGSGLMRGDLTVEYNGEGDDLVCIISGYLKSDPIKRVHRSPRYADLHPGYTLKREIDNDEGGGIAKRRLTYAQGKAMREAGEIDEGMRLFPLGSPLWDRKPKVQIFYDTSRDWVRIYAPRATLSVYTPDELEEYGPDFARDVTPSGPDADALHQRLAQSKPTGEGFRADVVEVGLKPQRVRTHFRGQKAPQSDKEARGKAVRAPKGKEPLKPKTRTVRSARTGEAFEVDDKRDTLKEKPASEERGPVTKTVAGYARYLKAWLADAKSMQAILQRWKTERQLRNQCNLTAEDREPLQRLVDERVRKLQED